MILEKIKAFYSFYNTAQFIKNSLMLRVFTKIKGASFKINNSVQFDCYIGKRTNKVYYFTHDK